MTDSVNGDPASSEADIENPYLRRMATDTDQCKPVIHGLLIKTLLHAIDTRVRDAMGDGPRPKLAMDLEQIQVADYGSFEGISAEQKALIDRVQAAAPIQPEEMTFIALRSLFQFAWELPTSENDIRQAAAHEYLLDGYLRGPALSAASQLTQASPLLPYWGRLAFLRVMAEIPEENISRFGLEKVAVTLLKRAKFNATTLAFDTGPLIGLNYGLQPILKQLNRYVLHFMSTDEMAGPKRLSRAWDAILPMVRYFWSNAISVTEVMGRTTVIYGQDNAFMAHELTTLQVDFILMHELGHVAMDHPVRMKRLKDSGGDLTAVQHEFEYQADGFAVGMLRSRLLRNLRTIHLAGEPMEERSAALAEAIGSHHDHQRAMGAVSLLFLHMDFVQRAGELLRDRLGDRSGLNARMDSHPHPASRLERLELMNLCDYPYTSPLRRYAEGLFENVLGHVAALEESELLEQLEA